MTFIELVEQVSATSGVKKSIVKKVLMDMGSHVHYAVSKGLRVKMPRFGTFYPVKSRSQSLFGRGVFSKPRNIIRFKQSRGSRP